jgi:hypothetical protein
MSSNFWVTLIDPHVRSCALLWIRELNFVHDRLGFSSLLVLPPARLVGTHQLEISCMSTRFLYIPL